MSEDRDQELADLRAEVERLRARDEDRLADLRQANLWSWEFKERAEAAEARLRAVEALADELEGGESERTVQEWLDDLHAVLASVPSGGVAPTEQAGEDREGCVTHQAHWPFGDGVCDAIKSGAVGGGACCRPHQRVPAATPTAEAGVE